MERKGKFSIEFLTGLVTGVLICQVLSTLADIVVKLALILNK